MEKCEKRDTCWRRKELQQWVKGIILSSQSLGREPLLVSVLSWQQQPGIESGRGLDVFRPEQQVLAVARRRSTLHLLQEPGRSWCETWEWFWVYVPPAWRAWWVWFSAGRRVPVGTVVSRRRLRSAPPCGERRNSRSGSGPSRPCPSANVKRELRELQTSNVNNLQSAKLGQLKVMNLKSELCKRITWKAWMMGTQDCSSHEQTQTVGNNDDYWR